MTRCIYCHLVKDLDSKGRCPSCADAGDATQPIPERFCVICGKRITSPRKKVTCSPECAVTYKRQWERDRKRKLKQKGNAK